MKQTRLNGHNESVNDKIMLTTRFEKPIFDALKQHCETNNIPASRMVNYIVKKHFGVSADANGV